MKRQKHSLVERLTAMEIDLRLVGLIGVLLLIWIAFDLMTGGRFITPRNLFTLSVQTASVAVMATGMVFIIVLRHIDLSVGSVLGVVAMVMGALQTNILPQLLGLGHPLIWILTVLAGLALGAAIGALQGAIVGYLAVPAFIVTVGGLLIWRGAAWWVTQGQTVAPLDPTFMLLGGGAEGAIGARWSWLLGAGLCVLLVLYMAQHRQARRGHGFQTRPLWAELALGLGLCSIILGAVGVMSAYEVPTRAAERILEARGAPIPEGGPVMYHGVAIPVVLLLAIAGAMTFIGSKTRFGRYIFATGGNPDAASLAGVDTRKLTVKAFALMGALCAVGAVIASARLRSAANDLGTLDELRVIAAAVIGGTSLAGGVGTIYGAVLGALVMQSLQSGMASVGVNTSLQAIVIGVVLVAAVWVDQAYRRVAGEA